MPEGLSVVLYCPEPIRFYVANLVAHCFGLTSTLREKVFFEDGDVTNPVLENLSTKNGSSDAETSFCQEELHSEINNMLERHDSGLREVVITQDFIEHLKRLLDLIKHKIDRKQISIAEVQVESLEKWFDSNWFHSKSRSTTLLKKELDALINEIPTLSAQEIIKQSIYQFYDL